MPCVGDFIQQPFDPEMDWAGFSVQLRESQIPRLHEILSSIDEEQLLALQVVCGHHERRSSGNHREPCD